MFSMLGFYYLLQKVTRLKSRIQLATMIKSVVKICANKHYQKSHPEKNVEFNSIQSKVPWYQGGEKKLNTNITFLWKSWTLFKYNFEFLTLSLLISSRRKKLWKKVLSYQRGSTGLQIINKINLKLHCWKKSYTEIDLTYFMTNCFKIINVNCSLTGF